MKKTILVALLAAAVLGGCVRTAAIYNVKEAPVTTAAGKKLSAQQVRSAIVTAGSTLGWAMKDAGPHKLEGTLRLRTHIAVVEIPYTAEAYGIEYKSSDGLDAAADGTIHNNYNGWVRNLDRAIKMEIARL